MKTIAKIISLSLAAIMLLAVLASCGSKDALEGKWTGNTVEENPENQIGFTFELDGKGNAKIENEYGFGGEGPYEISGTTVTFKAVEGSMWDSDMTYEFKVDGNNLSLTATNGFGASFELSK